jgi:hypothetical protein
MFDVLEQLTLNVVFSPKVQDSSPKISVPINYEIVSLWVRDSNKGSEHLDIQARLLDPKGEELAASRFSGEFLENTRRLRTRLKISGIVITFAGNYTVEVSYKETVSDDFEVVAKVPLEVAIDFVEK